ncbi:3-oxo-5-alpha-steroid 4-dehydrogenase-domain-containing protein [Cokeromyces recurvatus]|uniref:3-oxo-5-alpha-steroid 4-dehydrogenase-domain-containing protein n=1 Tax=Cokeromyces recurvatus TaxID=90255 RepID=UPI00221F9EAC|nr:3-oxo-5-alpha-steroid 4-dehydrogenase-domain-containing protein [Cokeromyces recurvatus]KAI7902955.1 3-oxo-5-alpha-steroid 4-dehydrogenase-domain-containing protein [Cokeromyces recurvatus]
MKVTIASRNPKSSKFPITLELPGTAATLHATDINKALAAKFPVYYPERQRLTTSDKKPLETDKTLQELGIDETTTIYFKDLGPQIGWRTVFLIEYAGPLFIHPIFYYCSKWIYGNAVHHSDMQKWTYYLVLAHFLKRELETLWVHRFSHGTMPFRNVFKNSAHYWLLSGVNLAFWVYGPWFGQGKNLAIRNDVWLFGCVAVWAWAEISNLITHITLRNLRPPGTRVRAIPYGYGFDLVSCPNYFFEFVAWTAICFLTTSWSAFLFNIVATGQMYVWAIKKHKNYRKEFKEYPRNRKAMFPFIA